MITDPMKTATYKRLANLARNIDGMHEPGAADEASIEG